jgi:hypothetical protein
MINKEVENLRNLLNIGKPLKTYYLNMAISEEKS